MAASVDGDIRLSVGLDTSSIESQLKSLMGSFGKNAAKIVENNASKGFDTMTKSAEATNKQIQTIAKTTDTVSTSVSKSEKATDGLFKRMWKGYTEVLRAVGDMSSKGQQAFDRLDTKANQSQNKLAKYAMKVAGSLRNFYTQTFGEVTDDNGTISTIEKTIQEERKLGEVAQETNEKINNNYSNMSAKQMQAQFQMDKAVQRLEQLKQKQAEIASGEALSKIYEKNAVEVNKAVAKLKELEKQKELLDIPIQSNIYASMVNGAEKVEAEMDKIEAQMDTITDPKMGAKLGAQLDALMGKLDYYKQKMKELEESGQAYVAGPDTKEYREAAKAVEEQTQKVEELRQKQEQSNAAAARGQAEAYNQATQNVENQERYIEILKAKQAEIPEASKKAANKSQHYFGKAFDKIKNLGSKMVNGIKGFFNKIKDRSKDSANSMDKFFKHGFRNILKYALGIRSFYFLFRKIRSAAKEALTAMAIQFPEVNAQLSELKNSFIQLKGSVGTLVQPLLQALAPALTTIINLFSEALSVVGSFFALLTGQKFIYKAKKGVSSFAAAQDESTGATKKNTDALEDNQKQLGNYDKLNIIDQQRDKAGAGGGGGGAGGGAGEMMFEKVPIDSQVKDFMDRFKDAWKKGDLTEIGTIIGTKLKNALDKIPWHGIQAKAEQVGKNLGTLIAGFIKTPGLAKSIGNAIGQALNTLLMGLRKLVKHVPWYEFGEFLADMLSSAFTAKDKNGTTLIGNIAKTIVAILNAAIDTIKGFADKMQDKWSKIGDEISKWIQWAIKNIKVGDFMEACAKLINGIVTVIYKIVSNKDTWKSLGSKVAEGINKFFHTMNWGDFAKTISDGLLGLGTAIITALDEIDWDAVGEAVADFLGNINWIELLVTVGKIIVKALGGAIKAAISALKKDPWGIASAFVTVFGGLFVFKKLKGLVPILKNSFSKIFSLSVEQSLEGKEVEAAAKSATKTGIIGNIKGAFGKLKGTLTKDLGKGMSGVLNGLKNHAGLIAAAAGIGLAIGGWIADKINAEMDKWYDETAKRAKDAAAKVKTILGKAQSEGATKDQQAELLRKQYGAVQKVIDNNQKAMEKIEDIYVIPGMEATDINYMNAQRTVTEGQSARKEIQDQYKELTGSLEGLTGASDNAYKSLGKVDSMITSPPKGVDPAKWLTASSKMKSALDKLEMPDSKKNAILKKLRDMVDQGKISFEQYEKIAGGSYQTTKDLYEEIGKVAGKKVKAEVKAEVKGTKEVNTLESKLKAMSGKQYTTKQIVKIQAQYSDPAVKAAFASGHFSVSDYIMNIRKKATGGIFTGSGWHNIEGYAKGGMPKSGQFFMARENGIPELVGTIKNHTAVMNNGQIVASVANGVYQAVASVAKVILPYVRSQTYAMNWLAQNGLQLPDITIGNILPSNSNFLNALRGTNTTTNNVTNGVDYDMLVQAFKEAQTNQPIVVQMPNGKVLAEVVWNEEQKKYKQARSSTLQVNYA